MTDDEYAPLEELYVGGIYSVSSDDGFALVKVLAADEEAVHVCLYAQRFPTRPKTTDPATLTVSVGHAPLHIEGLLGWSPQLVARAAVSEEELTGYRYWAQATYGGEA